jgi:ribosomal 30S subunit maturation factor RimM
VIGSTVVNDQNETIGKIDDMIVDRDKVLFSVINVGGFLGIGGRLVAVPFSSLNVDYNTGKIILPGATKDALKNLPEFKYA